ncbi:MAG: hypothetical protein AB7J13_02490 [Pyrinomonadaceae bacterium]
MSRKFVFSLTFGIALLLGTSLGAFAQGAPISGTVEMKKADGTREPVADLLVELIRADVNASLPSAKTNAKGQFSFAGAQAGWTLILSVSGPGIAPTYLPDVRAGQEKILITVEPGTGIRFEEDQVRQAAADAKAGKTLTEEEKKKAQAAYEAEVKAVEAKNKKAEETNKIVTESLKAGNDAFSAKNYDMAIAEYEKGIAADPDYVGSAPILNNNRSIALMTRAIDVYNRSVKLTEISEKVAGLKSAREDLAASAEGFLTSWNTLIKAPAASIPDQTNFENTKLATLSGARDTFNMAVRTEQVDPTVIEAAKTLIPAYMAAERDTAKKAQANLIFADLYRVVGDSDNAIAGYMKILESQPDNQDALAGAGLSLVNLGYINEDKAKLQEGSNYLQKFVSLAPDNHKYKGDAIATIDMLKKDQNVTPQKVTTKKKP